MTTRRILLAFVAAGLLLLALFGAIAWRQAAPWLAWPDLQGDALDRQWAELAARAADHPLCRGRAARLEEAVRAHDASEAMEDLLYEQEGPIALDDLPAEAHRSGEILVAWAEAGGGVTPMLSMESSSDVLDLYRVGKAAAATDDPARVAAALRLAEGLRRCGPLVSGAVGFAIHQEAQKRQPDMVAEHPGLRPDADDLIAILHAEAVTGDQAIAMLAEQPSDGWESWLLDPEREQTVLRAMWVQRLAGLPPEPEAIVRAFPKEYPEDLPRSLVAEMLWTGIGYVVGDLAGQLEP